jgi:hypothetical protein
MNRTQADSLLRQVLAAREQALRDEQPGARPLGPAIVAAARAAEAMHRAQTHAPDERTGENRA